MLDIKLLRNNFEEVEKLKNQLIERILKYEDK